MRLGASGSMHPAALLVALLGPLVFEGSAGTANAAPAALQTQPSTCEEWVADFSLAARLRLADTPFGAGDGTHDIGPGRLRLRFSRTPDPAVSKVDLLAYEMHEKIVVKSGVLFVHATITTQSDTRATPDERGIIATGVLRDRELRWSSPVRGYRTDGSIHCEGSGCGLSGVPPSGTTPLHVPPHAVQFATFVFDSAARDTLRMSEAKVAQTDMPKQTAFLVLSGRRMTPPCQ